MREGWCGSVSRRRKEGLAGGIGFRKESQGREGWAERRQEL